MPTSARVIPADVHLAAKRGFVRTLYQGYAGTLSAGLSATAVLAIVNGEVDLTTAIVTAAVVLLGPPVAALAAYLNISSKGIPNDYQDDVVVVEAVEEPPSTGRHRADGPAV